MLPVLTATVAATRRATRCAGAGRRSTSPASARRNCTWPARRSRGARSAARSARATGRPARRRCTSTPTSRWPRSAISTGRRTTRSSERYAVPMLVETARLWMSLGYHGEDEQVPHRRRHRAGRVQRDRARQHLHEPGGGAEPRSRRPTSPQRWPKAADELDVTEDEIDDVARAAAERSRCPYDDERGVHAAGSRQHRPRGLGLRGGARRRAATRCCSTSPYLEIYRKQVVKQADLVLAMHWFGDAVQRSRTRRARSSTTSAITVRDSSLSACTQAIIAAEVGHLDLAVRLPHRGGDDGSARPRAQHARRAAHRLAGRHLARRRRRLRRDARPRRPALVPAAARAGLDAAALPPRLARGAPARRDRTGAR